MATRWNQLLGALAVAAHLMTSAAGQSIDGMVAIHPIPRSVVDEYAVAAAIPRASAQAIADAYEEYRRRTDARIAEARRAVEDAGIAELQALTSELTTPIRVDLPAPFGPSRAKKSPGATSSETPLRAITPLS